MRLNMTEGPKFHDSFAAARPAKTTEITYQGENILMLLDWRTVREAARDWKTFSSDAPFRVPIPSEEDVRNVRQLPIEADPPLHTEIRRQLEPWFRRPSDPDYIEALDALIVQEIVRVRGAGAIDLVRDFALPLQSRALALLLAMPQEAADTWIGWGTHVFRDGKDGSEKGAELDQYIRAEIERAIETPRDDFFSALTRFRIGERPLNEDEMAGIANLTFAGGRDTIINTITTIIAWFADRRDELKTIVADQQKINLIVEEFVRITSPLTHIGRLCPAAAKIADQEIAAGARASLCWAAANYDAAMFDRPEELRADRSPNPHLGFGSGHHVCLGATHARALLRLLISRLNSDTGEIAIIHATPQQETIDRFLRVLGYSKLEGQLS